VNQVLSRITQLTDSFLATVLMHHWFYLLCKLRTTNHWIIIYYLKLVTQLLFDSRSPLVCTYVLTKLFISVWTQSHRVFRVLFSSIHLHHLSSLDPCQPRLLPACPPLLAESKQMEHVMSIVVQLFILVQWFDSTQTLAAFKCTISNVNLSLYLKRY